jgi:hypothetical protein
MAIVCGLIPLVVRLLGVYMFQILSRIVMFICVGLIFTACGKDTPTYSLLAEQNFFNQAVSTVNNKIDIIWIVDASGTMVNHQNNLATNFGAFINDFVDNGYDYHMVVASTDGWVREFNYNAGGCVANPNSTLNPNTIYKSSADCANTKATYGALTHFRDGDIYGAQNGTPGTRSGTYLLTSEMNQTDVSNLFAVNIRTGTRGDGVAESGYQSLRSVLRRNEDGTVGYSGETHTVLDSFRRPDAFLAVIVVSDEEDQARKQVGGAYASTQAYTDSFVGFLDGYTGGVEGNRRYSVSTMVIDDINNCAYGLHPQATQGNRYLAVAAATDGIAGSICSNDFSNQLSAISQKIATLSTQFQLNREPIESTIAVTVNGAAIPNNVTNGWTYLSTGGFYYIKFHGTAIPPQGAQIAVNFDPVTIQ